MQFKMSSTFNSKVVRQILAEEEKYISDVFSKMPFTIMDEGSREEDKDENNQAQNVKIGKIFSIPGENAKRAQTFEELHAKLDELKRKGRLDHRQRKVKKGLKNKIKKKSKKEERKINKKIVETEQIAAGSTKIKEENGETSKVPKQKPIFNSEGHIVFSKFDFSQIGTKRKFKDEKNPKKILEQMEQKKQKVNELVESGEKKKAEKIIEKEAWKTVFAKASGEKRRSRTFEEIDKTRDTEEEAKLEKMGNKDRRSPKKYSRKTTETTRKYHEEKKTEEDE
ncbi:surfeit locus protein 6 homolog isoform X2 [Belonocnema kinseyi]|uniref:surfeit locus protein 6 homolog isoform X2 n=1 Tax=Belonocnema kinseyi TaxID=2817044 RepID=UPI00143CC1AD|nr:surfeit locus protein 6 homolog isoform X2 [Belonocnema kinseyi]